MNSNTVKLSDWVADQLVAHGIRDAFMITGGGAMHLNHSIGTNAGITTIFCHHEQALAMAAEAYGRLTNRLALVNTTSGPGGTNALTGIYGAFVDSVGVLVISGQVKTETTVQYTGLPLRQYGDQELDITPIVKTITKYAMMVTDPLSIRYHLTKAIYLARSGRPGPTWLDIPLDVQAAKIDPAELYPAFDPAELDEPWKHTDIPAAAARIIERLRQARRPVVFAGAGVRLSGAHAEFLKLIERLGIPVVTGWNAHDVIWNAHPLYCGRPSTVGDRGGNLVSFARAAYKVWVDIDPLELQKPNVKPDMPVVADLKDLIPALTAAAPEAPTTEQVEWLEWSRERNRRFPVMQPEYRDSPRLCNPYVAMEALFEQLEDGEVIVSANATPSVVGFQVAYLRPGQRMWGNSGCATMGYDLPAAIGVCAAQPEARRVICMAGDGSIMMNLQELQTIAGNNLPVKIILLNNSGYVSIFQTHRNFFNGVEVGGGPKSGVTFPDFSKLAVAFGLGYARAQSHDELHDALAAVLECEGPAICEIMIDENVVFAPKLGAKQHPDGRITSPPLEDLSPFLPREVLRANMLIDMIEE